MDLLWVFYIDSVCVCGWGGEGVLGGDPRLFLMSLIDKLQALRNATRTYRVHKSSWEGLMKRGMQRDYTWENAAIQYEQVFEWVFLDPPYVSWECKEKKERKNNDKIPTF